MSRAYTASEARKIFLDHVRDLVDYWSNVEGRDTKSKLNGLAFSILATLDGSSQGIPAIELVLRPHPEDKEYHQLLGENWFEEDQWICEEAMLHEEYYKQGN